MANKPIKSINLLPEFLRTEKNSKFLSSTIDQLVQPPQIERLDGFIGSKLTPTYVSTSDVYVSETLSLRRDFQLEPALIIKDELGNIEQAKSIDDIANEINVEGGLINNFDRMFRPEIYSFNPQIDFDKFVNYQKYYWLTSGPQTVGITGKQLNSTSTYTVSDNEIKSAWILTPDGLTEDPTIILYRGNTYNFSISSEYKFFIKTAPSLGQQDVYNIGVTNNGTNNGLLTLTVSNTTPSTLYFTSDEVNFVQGKIVIKQATEDAYLNVETEILGKKNYTSGTGLNLSNGMKIKFDGIVYPEFYREKEFYVEGVGKAIKLVNSELLEVSEKLSAQFDDDFDATNFDQYPFDNFRRLPLVPEYITINRSSKDLNPWSRYNRWIHEDIIKISAEANNQIPNYPADKRARRPIIEFRADLQLFNFGSVGVQNVDLIDNDTLDAFSIVEGSAGYYVDGILLQQGHRVIFNADTDNLVRGKIYEVNFLNINGIPKLELKPTDDHEPVYGSSLSINLGLENTGKSWWYNGSNWILSQQHDKLNQPPVFDIFDSNGISFSSDDYDTDFAGTKIFGYEIGTGNPDPVLGFPLSYQNTSNVASYKFKNYFNSDTISIFENNQVSVKDVSTTFLRINQDQDHQYENVWQFAEPYQIPILQLTTTAQSTTTVSLNAIDNPDTEIFTLQVFINGTKIPDDNWYTLKTPKKCNVGFFDELPVNTNVLFKIYTRAAVNQNGQYETPINLTNNPLNGPLTTLTLTEISDHYKSMTERALDFTGQVFGSNNSRDLPDITKYGSRLIANATPIAFTNFFVGVKEHDAINAIKKSADQYNQFKSLLLKKISELGDINDPISALDIVMTDINQSKDLNSPWFYSGMLPYGSDRTTRIWTVTDIRNTIYPLAQEYDPSLLQYRSILIYRNNRQLIIDKDYKFIKNEANVEFLVQLSVGDQLRIEDYFNVTPSYIPSTPTSLGLYPKFEPSIYVDNSYVIPTNVIQGHDGSVMKAFDDFRDDIILEYEKRVFNSIKVQYNEDLFDINSVLPGGFRNNQYSIDEINQILRSDFIRWVGANNVDYITNSTFDFDNSFTWNYLDAYNATTNFNVNGYWRSFYKYFYDTDRPNTHPWEMLGFSQQPDWWEDQYGPVPCTSGNNILWEDLELGIIRQGYRSGTHAMYARPGLSNMIPVDQFGNLVQPSTLITDTTSANIRQNWKFGDHAPVETAWRRSSYYPFAIQRLLILTKPAAYCSLLYDPSRMKKNIANQWRYGSELNLLTPKSVYVNGDGTNLTAGYSAFVSEIGLQRNSQYIDRLKNDLAYLDFNLFHKVGGFVSKNKLQIVIDSIDPSSASTGALLPQENYRLILNQGNPIQTATISGIIIQKSNGKFIIKGYDNNYPYFTILPAKRNSGTPAITIGGVSEPFVRWTASEDTGSTNLDSEDTATANTAVAGNFYRQGQVVFYDQNYYRTTISHRAGSSFVAANFVLLRSLPIVGGATVQIANGFFNEPVLIPYGTEYDNIQSLYDMLIGYGKWLETQGFLFDEYNSNLNELIDWNLSAKEFLYWTTQNWAENTIITLSPFANKIKFKSTDGVVDNIFDDFYEYTILKADGLPLAQKSVNVFRNESICTIETVNTTDGIYFAQLRTLQKEHAMVFDNTTIFNDVIYDIESGYRQRRMKLIGFRTSNWNGDYFSPGFIYDEAEFTDWSKFNSYRYGDTVRYNGKYYSAKQNVSASNTFDYNSWVLLTEKPEQNLIPNFEYKINQFEDFYSLDVDNFDIAQQQMAQGLIGFKPRSYMNNIIINPISQYKFYQGFIKEKGTKSAVEKMAKVSIFNLQGETSFSEEWALRLGNFGSYSSFQELEIGLPEGAFLENPQIVNFVQQRPNNPIDLIFYSTASNIAIEPEDYNPTFTFVTTATNNFKLPNAGYVNYEDITATAYNENSLLDIANSQQLNNGDIFWLGFKTNGNWDVLRYTLKNARITGVYVSSPGIDITFVTDLFHGLSVGDIINVARFNQQVNGVYRVKSVSKLNQFTVSSELTTILNEELLSPGLLYKFQSVRFVDFDRLPPDADMLTYPYDTKFWIDNQAISGNYDWKVFEKIQNFNNNRIQSGISYTGEKFGFSISKKQDSNLVVVGSPGFANIVDTGRAYVFLKNNETSNRLTSFTLNNGVNQYHSSTGTTEFGFAVDHSLKIFPGTNYGLIFTGAPSVTDIATTGTILRYSISTANQSTASGAVKIISINPITILDNTEIVLVSPNNIDRERFGSSLIYNDFTNQLIVGAPGTEATGTGAAYVYQTITPEVRTKVVSTASAGASQIYVQSTASIQVGQTVWISGILNNIVNGVKVSAIDGDGDLNYITLDTLLPANIASDSYLRFYNTSTINTTYGFTTSTNGLLTTFVGTITANTSVIGDQYGYAIARSLDGKYTAISAPGGDYVETFIDIGTNSVIRQVHTSTIGFSVRFGESLAMSADGKFMFIGAPEIKNEDDSFGQVAVYKRIGNTFTYTTVISNPVAQAGMKFGKDIVINNSTDTLAISAIGLNKSIPVDFDSNSTSFDSSSTQFYDIIENYGTVYIYNKDQGYDRFVLADEVNPQSTVGLVNSNFGYSLALDNNSIYVGAPSVNALSTSSFYQFNKIDENKQSLNLYKENQSLVDIDTVQKIRLINTFDETVIDYLDVIDPIKGKISGLADQELKYKSAYDPAVYSIGTAGVVVDTETSWLDEHIGELWWDLSTVKYVWYEQSDLIYRKNNWGNLFPGATIDVYEWVRTSYLPSEWIALADTNAGLAEGISGQPKYVDNSAISVKQIYNSVSNSFTNVYYFWVKNKVTLPDVKNRRTSAYQVANIIADPTSYGLKFAAILSTDAIALANVSNNLVGNRINLNIGIDPIKNKIPKHTEWTLIEEGSANSLPPSFYEKKLFDSLLGRDNLGNLVPDPTLTDRIKYGVGIRPRQTMFKNRREALRNLIEFANQILEENQITGTYSFKNLDAQELPPDQFSGEYDQIIEDNEGFNLIDTRNFQQARLNCEVENGKIIKINILNQGYGYKLPPKIIVQNNGVGAVLTSEIDNVGRIINVSITNSGSGYAISPTLLVRPYSVLVLADNLYNNKWTIFEWNRNNSDWERKRTQKYNTPLYWKYIDWKSVEFNEFIDYISTINQVYELDTLENILPGQYVKIKNVGDGRYIIVEKATDDDIGTFGKGYNLVYSQNGTIQILDTIWNIIDSNLGFDQQNNFDQTLYDQTPDQELGFILDALKDDIFINELKVYRNLFFFKAVKYAMTEQKLLDWAFKTSFINVTNFAGYLDQRPVYKIRSSENYENYLKEIKPYHSQIRTFTANHQILDPSNSFITDFDLPSYYNQDTNQFELMDLSNPLIDQQPYKSWKDNYTYKVGSIIVGDGGANYTFPPQVIIETVPGDTGFGASAIAYINSGKLSQIEIINPGSDYKIAPTVKVLGGGDSTLTTATVYAQLVNEKVRVNKIGLKFDRISTGLTIGQNQASDSWICDGSKNEFVLTWYAESEKSKVTVLLDGDLVLSSTYDLVEFESEFNHYSKKFTKIVFTEFVPPYGQVLDIIYNKNINLYNAAERIINFYSPTSGMPDNDLAQVMQGIEYPGVSVQGLKFDYSTDWDIAYSPFGTSSYADDVGYYNKIDIIQSALAGTDTLYVSTTTGIKVGQLANLISAVKSQSTSSLFSSQITNSNADIKVVAIITATNQIKFNSTITQDLLGTSTNIYIDNVLTTVTNTATLELWSFDSNMAILDSSIEGGSWSTSTGQAIGALGINPEDIIIDGDKFLTPNTSFAPEEFVPGEIHDTLGINVYTRFNEGSPIIFNGSIDIYANAVTSATLGFIPPNADSIFVTYDNKNFAYSTSTDFLNTSTINSSLFTIDWADSKLIVGPQSSSGKLGYTIIGIGGGRPAIEPGILDRQVAVTDGQYKEAELRSFSSTGTAKSAYVTVNGEGIPLLTTSNTSTLGYIFDTSSIDPKKACVKVYNLSTGSESLIQAFFFGTVNKYFNEVKEQIFDLDFAFANSFIIDQPPGIKEPAAANIIVEIDDGTGYKRLQPPFISYYTVIDPSIRTFIVDKNINRSIGTFIFSNVRVYLNGVKLNYGSEWTFEPSTQQVEIRTGILNVGDEIAVLGKPGFAPFNDYDIDGNVLTLRNTVINVLLKITTFTNHDTLDLRTESFIGNLNRRFKVCREINNSNFLWVSVDGKFLRNNIDYTVLEDRKTVELSDKWALTSANLVVITTVKDTQLVSTVLGYRLFNDIFSRSHYKRLSKNSTTTLTQPLYDTDTEIHVSDASVLTPPLKSKKIPGVILINNERVEFQNIEGNTLKQLRRSTLGTGINKYLPIGTKLIDQSPEQNIPYFDSYLKQTVLTTSTTATYHIQALDFLSTVSVAGDQMLSNGIILSTTATVNPVDQIDVYYGGRKLRKSGTYMHDMSISFDSPEANIIGFTATTELLPTTDLINTAYVVTSTNEVWVYTGSIEKDSVNGYVYKGLKYLKPEYSITVAINTATALVYANTASQYLSTSSQDLSYDIDGSGTVTSTDVDMYTRLANGQYVDNININSNYVNLLNQTITLNIDEGIKDNVRLVIMKKAFNKSTIWNDQLSANSTRSLLNSTTLPAKFLQERPAELPDDTYFIGNFPIQLGNGLSLTDENNEPLEGI